MSEDASAFRFRSAINSDREEIENLVFTVLGEFGLAPDPETTDADLKDIQSHYLDRGGVFEVLVNAQKEIVGCWGLYPMDESTCELRKMYLRPEVRGHGLGKEIMRRALKQGKELGFRRMVLETASVLKAAIRLYKAAGFRPYLSDHMSSRTDQTFELDF